MKISKTRIDDCFLIEGVEFCDHRGSFEELYNAKRFEENGIPTNWVQDNISFSRSGVLRGLHIQTGSPQGKMVRVIKGRIFDVCIDLHPESPTFREWHMQELCGTSAMYCPPGTAHGFYAVEESIVLYKCTELWDPKTDGGIRWDDVDLAIPWGIKNPIVSDKDRALPTLKEWITLHLEGHKP